MGALGYHQLLSFSKQDFTLKSLRPHALCSKEPLAYAYLDMLSYTIVTSHVLPLICKFKSIKVKLTWRSSSPMPNNHMWLVATLLNVTNREHFHPHRKPFGEHWSTQQQTDEDLSQGTMAAQRVLSGLYHRVTDVAGPWKFRQIRDRCGTAKGCALANVSAVGIERILPLLSRGQGDDI